MTETLPADVQATRDFALLQALPHEPDAPMDYAYLLERYRNEPEEMSGLELMVLLAGFTALPDYAPGAATTNFRDVGDAAARSFPWPGFQSIMDFMDEQPFHPEALLQAAGLAGRMGIDPVAENLYHRFIGLCRGMGSSGDGRSTLSPILSLCPEDRLNFLQVYAGLHTGPRTRFEGPFGPVERVDILGRQPGSPWPEDPPEALFFHIAPEEAAQSGGQLLTA